MATNMTSAQKVEAYIKLRDYKKAAKAEFEKGMERTSQAMDKLEIELLADLQASGAKSIACDAGTVYRSEQLSATVEDRSEFLSFVKKHGVWDALDVKANKTAVRDYMEEHGMPIPGVKVSIHHTIGVQRK
jgi:hypothetical protein